MNHPTDWLSASHWGLFFHYLASPASSVNPAPLTAEEWNERVDSFNVDHFAAQTAAIGAPYVAFTIGQNSGFYCSPNTTYDQIVGITPTKCSRRDLIADIAAALRPYGIKLLACLPSNAPTQDVAALKKLRYTPPWDASASGGFDNRHCDPNTDERLTEFQEHWEAVIREWSERWGENVSGWWIDGLLFADRMYRRPDAPNFASFASALKAGNEKSLVAFNAGWVETTPRRRLDPLTPFEDYTAGEADSMFPICKGRWLEIGGKQVQWHVLTYAGSYWGKGTPRFPDEFVVGYTKHANAHGGVVTWDIPLNQQGDIPAQFISQMQRVRDACLTSAEQEVL